MSSRGMPVESPGIVSRWWVWVPALALGLGLPGSIAGGAGIARAGDDERKTVPATAGAAGVPGVAEDVVTFSEAPKDLIKASGGQVWALAFSPEER
jgi:hypothetical protein